MENTFRFTLDDSEGFLRVKLYGPVSVENVRVVFDAMTRSGQFTESRRLWDMRECRLDLSSDELLEMASVAKSRDLPDSRGAMLAPRDLNFGMSRMHQVFRKSDNISLRVFRDEKEAIAWVSS